ncbi:MAG: hypothetical protein PHC34_11150 [Candidatus Gastranaerophilales bacterium]|nr:hypothetical protein [Candidatus Gastranaerophilales bacterium]
MRNRLKNLFKGSCYKIENKSYLTIFQHSLKIEILLLTLIIGFSNVNNCQAFEQINKDLNLIKGYSYLLNFNDKIMRYSLGNNEAAKIEIISSIFNDKQEILLKTLKETDTNLLIWTKDNIYNFNVSIIPNKPSKILSVISEVKDNNPVIASSPKMQNFSKSDKYLPDDVKNKLEELSLDTPPNLPCKQDIFGFEIDQPPKM